MSEESNTSTATYSNCDQEDWVKSRIATAIRAALVVTKEKQVAADDDIINGALSGIVNGCASEVIRALGMRPSFINIRSYHNPLCTHYRGVVPVDAYASPEVLMPSVFEGVETPDNQSTNKG